MNTFRRILVPVDFSEASRAALDEAVRIARDSWGTIDLLHAWELPPLLPPDLLLVQAGEMRGTLGEVAREQARVPLEKLRNEVAGLGAGVRAFLVRGDASRAILEHARRHGNDIIVMGTHGRTGMAHAFLGSVAEKVVRRAGCPVLTVHAAKDAESTRSAGAA